MATEKSSAEALRKLRRAAVLLGRASDDPNAAQTIDSIGPLARVAAISASEYFIWSALADLGDSSLLDAWHARVTASPQRDFETESHEKEPREVLTREQRAADDAGVAGLFR